MLSQRKGRLAEQAALDHLRANGLRLVTRNFSCRIGEIDLVMAHQSALHAHILVFVEVRYRQHTQYGGAAASVTYTKQRRIIRTAKRYLQTHPRYRAWPSRFDVVAVSGAPNDPDLRWMRAAFDS